MGDGECQSIRIERSSVTCCGIALTMELFYGLLVKQLENDVEVYKLLVKEDENKVLYLV